MYCNEYEGIRCALEEVANQIKRKALLELEEKIDEVIAIFKPSQPPIPVDKEQFMDAKEKINEKETETTKERSC